MRDTTERPEALDAGTVKLVGTNYKAIISSVSELLDSSTVYEKCPKRLILMVTDLLVGAL